MAITAYYMVLSSDKMQPYNSVEKYRVEPILKQTYTEAHKQAEVLAIAEPTRKFYIVQLRATVEATGPIKVEYAYSN